ncbi:4-deoxy-L-threo-5-hexosulose-uronate ketol-isomerase [Lewinella marina]|uniref:4-deoxy-L-threo-5-hexosulose-uronate ketol-isomerase n=1 Tax=Neolewinella marina TaxID=438751 RepID=A0A2G0CGB2_9BACT|nr:5-dehydro-4-deoxy-D-glucuronate isomerase [Neolewinella marina]NJB86530.1 4-deoxy-L-threo-5-hexosulose-uronate ketol-isomerase [Neolewinella marina]PHK99016.1 5-dehydro-4-deoxy-D-glucuronate isomerase [Neolewinella marina]
MQTRYGIHPTHFTRLNTQEIRDEYLATGLLQEGRIELLHSHYDRFIFGGAVPTTTPLSLENDDDLRAEFFLERRELGILNLGGAGAVTVDGTRYSMARFDCLYVGRGAREVTFSSSAAANPARFYLNSAPSHAEHPTTHCSQQDANRVELGNKDHANQRVLYQYIHENGIQSSQLVMGFTELLPGNIWNTFPPHTHERRMEVYLYFDLPEDELVMHFMGQPRETRHLAVRNFEAVISPPWSIHSGAGTANYRFVWGMAGENQSFSDMDAAALDEIR